MTEVNKLDGIIEVEGIDNIVVDPNDLSSSIHFKNIYRNYLLSINLK